jgi:glycosyltransferase involved in cell wall biosynthesis
VANPKVSILLPSLNAREFLEPRIESLLNQAVADWEAIVLDSQSTDGTWEFVQSVAERDPRFRLHQVPREGLYAAINRGIDLATGEFFHVATADDTMAPEFLAQMLNALSRCPDAAIAACNALFIDRDGQKLSPANPALRRALSPRAIRELLEISTVRTVFLSEKQDQINYRPVPHDCLLHFSGRSAYCSLTQLLLRTESARAIGPFRTDIGSVADFDWLVRATNRFATVHLPRRLATWRFHGNQLSIYRDPGRGSVQSMCEQILPEICARHKLSLTRNDRAALLLPIKTRLCGSTIKRIYYWFESLFRLARMFVERPAATLRALRRVRFRFGTRRHTLLPMIFQGAGLAPRDVETLRG